MGARSGLAIVDLRIMNSMAFVIARWHAQARAVIAA